MIETLINLFNQLTPNQTQEIINSSWNQLRLLYQNKSIIQPLIQVYVNSPEPFYKMQSLYGIKSSLVQSFIHFNQTELYMIADQIVDIYLDEQNDFLRIQISDIICYLINHTRQSWQQLDHLIFDFHVKSSDYLKIFYHYSMLFPNAELILRKIAQSFESDLKTQLGGFEILLFFNSKKQKKIDLFSQKIQEMVRLLFTCNNVDYINTFLILYRRYFTKVYPFCPIFLLISNLNNYDLSPSILLLIRDFINLNFVEMIDYHYKISIGNLGNKEKFYQEIIIQIFTQEISLSNYLFSIEIDEMTTTSETFIQLIEYVPKELIEKTISELSTSNNIPSIITMIALFSAFIQKYDGNEEHYNFIVSLLNINENNIRKMIMDTLYDLRESFKKFYQIPLIKFLIDWTVNLKANDNDNRYLIDQILILMSKFILEFEDITPILNDLFIFGIKFFNDGNESEILDILNLFNFMISVTQNKEEDFSEFYSQILQAVCQLVNSCNFDNVKGFAFTTFSTLLFANKSIFIPHLDVFLQNFSDVYSLKFISILLAYFEEKVSIVIQNNIQKILEICDTEFDDPLKSLSAYDTEVTIFAYFKAEIKISPSIFKLFFHLIQALPSSMYQGFKEPTNTLFNSLSDYDGQYDPNSLTPFLLKFMDISIEVGQLIIEIVMIIIENFQNKFNTLPFLEYSLNLIESIFQSKEVYLFDTILISFCDFFQNSIEILEMSQCQEILPKVTQFALSHLQSNDQIIRLVCLRFFLYCEQKVSIQDPMIIEKVVNFLNEPEIENKQADLSDEICCTAARFFRFMILKDQENAFKYSQPIVNLSLIKLNNSHDQELSENLIFILINLGSFYEQDEKIISSILSKFPIRIDNSLFGCCYGWLIQMANDLSDELKMLAFRSIILFVVCDIRQFYQNGDVSKEYLASMFSIISPLPQQLVLGMLNDNENLLKVFISHMNYISSLLKELK